MSQAPVRLAYLARGQLHLLTEGTPPRALESAFAQQVRTRATSQAQRNAWKTQGSGAQFMRGGVLWGQGEGGDPAAIPVRITGVTPAADGHLLYTLDTGEVSGLFARDPAAPDADGNAETRLYHGNTWRVAAPAAHPAAPLVACHVPNLRTGTSHLAVLSRDGGRLEEVTEGDTVDAHPAWVPPSVPGPRGRLVYESAGVGRGPGGEFLELGPTCVHALDLQSGAMELLAQEEGFDLCRPRVGADGALYYVRRPRLRRASLGPLALGRFLLDVVLLPFRLLGAFFQFLNFFTVRYTGKPLDTSRGVRQRQADLKRMALWGNVLSAQHAAAVDAATPEPVRAPGTWHLVRKAPGGTAAPEVLARGVAVYDVGVDGSVVYSDGVELRFRAPDGTERTVGKAAQGQVEQVALLGPATGAASLQAG